MRLPAFRTVVLFLLVLALNTAPTRAENLIQCGGSARGLSSLVSAGLDAAAKKSKEGFSITHQTSSGGYANIVQIMQGKCQLGSVILGQAMQAVDGTAPFKHPVTGFSAIMVALNRVPMQWVMSKSFADKYGITSIEDLAKKKPPLRLILNRRGILPSQLGEESLAAVGVDLKDIEAWGGNVQFLASRSAASVMQDRRADMWVNGTLVGSSAIRKIANAMPVKLLQIPEHVRNLMIKTYGDQPFTIPAGAYPWLDYDVPSHTSQSLIIVKNTMDEDIVYKLTKALIENVGRIQAVHPAMKFLTPEVMASLRGFPYHPGAVRAYKEAGLM